MDKKQGERKDSTGSNTSDVSHEYLFDEIPTERPHSEPHLKKHQLFEDSKRRSSGGSDGKNETSLVETGTGDGKISKAVEIGRYDLYKEAMYTCVHMLGTPTQKRFPATQEDMCLYVHEVFGESKKEQDAVFSHVRNEPFPLTIVNAKVKRALGLHGTKSNGFVDPYCIVTIETEDSSVVFQLGKKDWQQFSTNSPVRKSIEIALARTKTLRPPAQTRSAQIYEKVPSFIKTSVLRHNPNPRWDQRFQCLALRPSVDKLTVEVWDHSIDDKYVAKAIRNYSDTAGDLDTTLKSVHANADRKKGDIFMGKVSVRISEIPCDGLDQWYYLSHPQHSDSESDGKLRIQIWLVHAYRHGRHYVELAEPKVILALFWDWVLKDAKQKSPNPDRWDGSISSPATCFLFQYALQNGISEDTHAIIRWNAYAKLDLDLHAVEGRLHDLNQVIEKHLEKVEEEEVKTPSPIQSVIPAKDPSPVQSVVPAKPPSPVVSKTPVMIPEKPKPEPPPLPPPPPYIKDSQADIEDQVLQIVMDKILPIIRNHLNENVCTVHEALRSYRECKQLLAKFDKMEQVERIERLVISAIRMSILEWYQEVYNRVVPTQGDVPKSDYVKAVATVMKEVDSLLRVAASKWTKEFFLIANIQYFPIVYDDLQKMVIHDVEASCWIFFQTYGEYKALRKILLGNEEKDKNLCKEFFELYAQTQTFVLAWVDLLPNGTEDFCCLDQYHRWFRPTLILWLGFALIRGSTMISKAITIDNNVLDDDHAMTMTSSSALDTANVFIQLIKFWEALNWPDIAEAYVMINFLTEVMCSYTILYAELKHAKLDREGYYDPRGRFTISERLCTALNNIEHVKEHALSIPKEIKHEQLIERLDETCGKSEVVLSYQDRIKERLDQTMNIVNHHLAEIVDNVGLLIQKEILALVDETLRAVMELGSDDLEDAAHPIIAYLEDNIMTLQKALLPYNFHKMLQLLWNLVCHGIQLQSMKIQLDDMDSQYIFFRKLTKVIPNLEHYFKGGDAGLSKEELNTDHYKSLQQILSYLIMDTEELIRLYYHSQAQNYLNYNSEANLGTIRVRVGYWNSRLGIEIISASDLTPHDEPLTFLKYFKKMAPTSDAMVEIDLRPTNAFPNEKKQVTKVMWKNLNPAFDENFYWNVIPDECLQPSAVMVLTVKDYDLLTKNAFLGETLIPLHTIPGISKNPEPQPMNLVLHEVDRSNPLLSVLQTRTWDVTAKAFTEEQLSRFVEPVIVRRKVKK